MNLSIYLSQSKIRHILRVLPRWLTIYLKDVKSITDFKQEGVMIRLSFLEGSVWCDSVKDRLGPMTEVGVAGKEGRSQKN